MDVLTRQQIKGYDLRERIGAGGFGAVYKAFQSTVGREVAIKVILPGLANQPDFIRRFESEAQLIARLEHPHITPLYDYWRDPEGAYLVMRWLRGGSLRDALQNGAFELRVAALLLDQIAGALSLAHRNGVIHRDIKPGNILLDEDGNAYLTDFGIAKDLNLLTNYTQQDAIVGSPDYISPEQARSEPVTTRTDIYSLGATLYEVITGHHPFENVSAVERLYKHINDPLPEITVLEPGLQDAVNQVIQKATAKNPERRYPDALAFAADFRDAVGMNRASTSLVERLTQREHEVLHLIVEGLSNKEIAQQLTVAMSTIKWYINQIYSKLGVRSRAQAIARARELNLIVRPGESISDVHIPTEDFRPENPYKGLLAFQAADHQDFFGREKVTAKLVKRLSEPGEQGRFLAVVGPSGSGKSSLVKAGLIPALWRSEIAASEKWFVVEMLPGARPLDELEVALMKVAANQAGNLREQLQRDQYGLARVANLILPNDGSELVLVIDQFEEVFTLLQDEAARVHFLDLLHTAVTESRSRVRVVITLRADFYDRPLHYPQFGELIRSRMETIMPLSAEELERAIIRPAERVSVTFEPGLVASIIGDVNYQPGALPLLQYALTELFDQRQGHLLTHEAYQAIGGTIGALAKRAEEVYLSLGEADQEIARQLFLRLVTLGEGTEDTRRRTARSELQAIAADADAMDEVIDIFASYRLLSLDIDPGTRSPTIEVAHEALLREWERLRAWLNESRDEIKLQRQLTHLTREWRDAGQEPSFLLRGSRLEMFERWLAETGLAITSQERDFLKVSLAENERQIAEQQAQEEREALLDRRAYRRLQLAVGILLTASFFGILLTLGIFLQSQAAQRERDRAEEAQANAEQNANYASSIALAAAAKSALLSNNPDQALALAVAANTVIDSPPAFAQSALYETAVVPATREVFADESIVAAIISPDGRRALSWSEASVSPEITFVYWDLETGQILGQWTPEFMTLGYQPGTQHLWRVIFALNGETAYVIIPTSDLTGRGIIEFDVATGQEIRRFEPPDAGFQTPLHSMALSPDGQTLLAITGVPPKQDGSIIHDQIYVWDVTTGQIIRQLVLDMNGLADDARQTNCFTLSRDGEKLVTADDTGLIGLWNANTGELIRTYGAAIAGHSTWTCAVVTPVGIVALGDSTTAHTSFLTLWNEATGELLQQRSWDAAIGGFDLSPDGHTLALAHGSPQIPLFDVLTLQTTHELFGHGNGVLAVNFTPDGQHLLSSSRDLTLRLWNLENEAEILQMEGLIRPLAGIVISPDGRTLVSQEFDGPFTLWNLETGERIRVLGQTQSSRRGVVFSPDGNYLVHGTSIQDAPLVGCPGSGSDLILMDVASGEIVWQARKETGYLAPGIMFTHDGSQILTADWWCENAVTIWDAATGELLDKWEGHQMPTWSITASPDGNVIATGSQDKTAILWDAATRTIIHTLPHDATVVNVAFSPDRTKLLTGDENGTLRIWDTANGQQIQQLTGHTAVAPFGQFSPDGQYVLSGGRDGVIFVWNWQTGEAVRQFVSFGPFGSPVIFSPDGQSIVMADENNVIRRVNLMLEPGALLEWVYENRYVRDLTPDECRLYRVEAVCETRS